ncbi:MAG: alanine racemase [Candidatus Krumholzibacteria bacterium]|nr:alanine racemase [Candidatus Krumholzibacteria bacterium]
MPEEAVPEEVQANEPAPCDSPDWLTVAVDRSALMHNISVFRRLVEQPTRVLAVVKANAYGHGLLVAAEAFVAGGADLLGVHSWAEAQALRAGGVTVPVIVLGPVSGAEAVAAATAQVEITLPGLELLQEIAAALGETPLRVHLKVDTGVNRQGIRLPEWPAAREILANCPQLNLVGLSSHYADIEDTTEHDFAEHQMARFEEFAQVLAADGYPDLQRHMSCSAAALVWNRTHGDIARVGISAYGVWPSRETRVSVRQRGREEVSLLPAVTWQVRISQVREVPAGESVGYGRSWKAMTDSRVAVLPVGYSDGWPRALGGRAHVLIGGRRAPLVGRICMNLCMVDVTHVPEARAGDPAVLLGRQGSELITPEMLADHLNTIAYEVLTLPGPSWSRVVV